MVGSWSRGCGAAHVVRAETVGLNRITPLREAADNIVGYEYECKHPRHQLPRACKKQVRIRGRRAENGMVQMGF